jgi:hypothetical protein
VRRNATPSTAVLRTTLGPEKAYSEIIEGFFTCDWRLR